MNIEKKNVKDLLPADYNPRKDLKPGDAEYEKLKRSIEALGIESLPLEITDERVSFPWFHRDLTPDEVQTYMNFIANLCAMAKDAKRITATEKPVDNEKYAFRCFLLRLGFIGNEYKTQRKILLRNLTGSSAFKSGSRKEAAADAVSE